ncbi:NfeD family protein [Glaesserella sp.]|uniref:NfeD family protein n=1 Tax=Glaesserella sp. TaxID=2094731 RepID=UPI00359FE3B2
MEEWYSGWAAWLILGFGLLILETVAPGIFIMWWGFAAIIIAGLVAIFPEMGFSGQIIIFAVLAIVFSVAWWKYQHDKDTKDDKVSALNSREYSMLGARGTIVEILENGTVRGKFGDTTWRVSGADLKVGDAVEVVKVDGITLIVKK